MLSSILPGDVLMIRYKSDGEKAFVQSVIHMTQDMYEQDVVNQENELRSVMSSSIHAGTEADRMNTAQ